MRGLRSTWLLLLAAATAQASIAASATAADLPDPLWVGRFAEGVGDWRDVPVSENLTPTRYAPREWDGVAAIEARADRSMSLFARPLGPDSRLGQDSPLDLEATPVLCWRWRIDAPLVGADMTTRAGDDYAARVYVSFAMPPETLGFVTRLALRAGRAIWGEQLPDAAINYVWDNRHPVGTQRPNAYTDRTRMIVAQSGPGRAGRWVEERHDVAADVEAAFGRGARPVQLAIASDTDQTGESAHAGFADIHFVARDADCAFP